MLNKTERINVNRMLVNLLREKGYHNSEIVDITGISLTAVKQHIYQWKKESEKAAELMVVAELVTILADFLKMPVLESRLITRKKGN